SGHEDNSGPLSSRGGRGRPRSIDPSDKTIITAVAAAYRIIRRRYQLGRFSSPAESHRPPAASVRARADPALSLHPVAAGRIPLPPPADLLGIRRRGDHALRPVGRRLDDAGAAVALPSVGYIGNRSRPGTGAGPGALVSAVAVRPLVVAAGRRRLGL